MVRPLLAGSPQAMTQSGDQGACEAHCVAWETVPDDAQTLILGKLSLCELAQLATVCKGFRAACLNRAAQEGAPLVAAAQEALGKGVFSTFVTVLRRAISGLSPWIQGPVRGDDESPESRAARNKILITEGDSPTRATVGEIRDRISPGEPSAIIIADGRFEAQLTRSRAQGCSADFGYLSWRMYATISGKFRLDVDVPAQAAKLALGILLAVRLNSPEERPAFRERPFQVDFWVWGGPGGAARLRESQDLLVPLRALGESVAICVLTTSLGRPPCVLCKVMAGEHPGRCICTSDGP